MVVVNEQTIRVTMSRPVLSANMVVMVGTEVTYLLVMTLSMSSMKLSSAALTIWLGCRKCRQ